MKQQVVLLSEIRDLLRGGPAPRVNHEDEFQKLKELLASDAWPSAVDSDLICDETNEHSCDRRAQSVVDFVILDSLAGRNFLDFGCGQGHMVKYVSRKLGARFAVGYDLKDHGWGKRALDDPNKAVLTMDWSRVQAWGPYDTILVYDVLDHAEGGALEVLKRVRSVCRPDTRVVVLCHPWCSRTGAHLYRRLNKAYLHLVFDELELTRLGMPLDMRCEHVIHPQLTYENWFKQAGFDVVARNLRTDDVEGFFEREPAIAKRIKSRWSGSHEPELASGLKFPTFQLRIQMLDYTLKVKS